jgi:hypothetical protein
MPRSVRHFERRAVALTVLIAAALFWAPARAQEAGDPHLQASFDAITPDTPGVKVVLRNAPPSPPELDVGNDTKTPLVVMGYDLEPFVRIGPDGTYGNRHSRTFFLTQDPTGAGIPPPDAKPGAKPLWVKVDSHNEWRWWEARAKWRGPLPPGARTSLVAVTLGPWHVPALFGGRSISIGGRMFYKPILGTLSERLTGIVPTTGGLTVSVLQGPVPGFLVNNSSGKLLIVTGRDGREFLKIGRGGVDVNLSSASAHDTARFIALGTSGWHHVQNTPVVAWLERRAKYDGDEPIGSAARTRATLLRWSIPATLAGAPIRFDGVTEWVPIAVTTTAKKGSGFPVLLVAILALGAVILAAGAALALKRKG